MIRRPPRSTLDRSSAASDVYKRQPETIVLNEPIKNTKTSKGRPIAWTVSSKVVPVRALLDGPSTTDGLDAAVDHYQNVGFAEIFGGEASPSLLSNYHAPAAGQL